MQTQIDLQARFSKALEYHQQGLLEEARLGYQRILGLTPEAAGIWALLGTLMNQLTRHLEGIGYLGLALHIDPYNAATRSNLGNALRERGDFVEALHVLNSALCINPSFPEANINLGRLHLSLNNPISGTVCLERAIKTMPLWPQAYVALGIAASKGSLRKKASEAFKFCIILDPLYHEAYLHAGEFQILDGEFNEAICSFNKGMKLHRDEFNFSVGMARGLSSLERHQEAAVFAKQGIALRPDCALPYEIFATALYEQGNNSLALAIFDYAMVIDDNNATTIVNKSIIKLKSGEFETGWGLLAKRWKTIAHNNDFATFNQRMCSSGFNGRRLSIWHEQADGVGDQIFFCSILNDIRNDFSQINVSLDTRLLPIFKRSFPDITFIGQFELGPELYDGHLPMANLPSVFKKFMGETRPYAYLKSDPHQTELLRKLLKRKGKVLCGVTWESRREDRGRQKSVRLKDLLPLLTIPNLEFINLQYGDISSQLAELKNETGITIHQHEAIDNFSDLDGLSSLIDACDLVISTCNSTAHLAGALGKETHLLAPLRGKAQQWYWAPFGSRISPWYPSVHVYHQGEGCNWQKPIQEIQHQLKSSWSCPNDP
jgi:tetratricopeptide (TPR) repeat protein